MSAKEISWELTCYTLSYQKTRSGIAVKNYRMDRDKLVLIGRDGNVEENLDLHLIKKVGIFGFQGIELICSGGVFTLENMGHFDDRKCLIALMNAINHEPESLSDIDLLAKGEGQMEMNSAVAKLLLSYLQTY